MARIRSRTLPDMKKLRKQRTVAKNQLDANLIAPIIQPDCEQQVQIGWPTSSSIRKSRGAGLPVSDSTRQFCNQRYTTPNRQRNNPVPVESWPDKTVWCCDGYNEADPSVFNNWDGWTLHITHLIGQGDILDELIANMRCWICNSLAIAVRNFNDCKLCGTSYIIHWKELDEGQLVVEAEGVKGPCVCGKSYVPTGVHRS
ncbi:hypothetical protein QAD02_007192 [Eretmocerus hayati]|uniref:Uncharacterized protein n=1 Tax=Eretmocerus hayati TaxID=131215 RepID=A0ACC2N2Y7_9HYME|nr:hypothetical protein QAD02_007192 [Eretmocerus hayati]